MRNDSNATITEIWFELESFRQNIRAYDSLGHSLHFLTNDEIVGKLNDPKAIQSIRRGKLFLLWLLLEKNHPISPGETTTISVRYFKESNVNYSVGENVLSSALRFIFLFFKKHIIFGYKFKLGVNETLSVYVDIPLGFQAANVLRFLWSKPGGFRDLSEENTHFTFSPEFISFSISPRFRSQFVSRPVTQTFFMTYDLRPTYWESIGLTLMEWLIFSFTTFLVLLLDYPITGYVSVTSLISYATFVFVMLVALAFSYQRSELTSIPEFLVFLLCFLVIGVYEDVWFSAIITVPMLIAFQGAPVMLVYFVIKGYFNRRLK